MNRRFFPRPRHAAMALLGGAVAVAAPNGEDGRNATMPRIANSVVEVRYDTQTGTLTARDLPAGAVFLRDASLSGERGTARLAAVQEPGLGAGQAIEIGYPDGSSDRVMLFGEEPFLFLQPVFAGPDAAERTVREATVLDGDVLPDTPTGALRALGTAGLTAPDGHPGSYVFLALAAPETNAGVVGAWLTHDRGSGIVFSGTDSDRVRLRARIDYGRLPVAAGATVPGEIFALGRFDDARRGLERWADLVAQRYAITLPPQPSGYCTWYSSPHGGASDAAHIAELAEFASRELRPFGFDFVQIDDYWQDGKRRNGPAKVFCRHDPEGPYPDGMKPSADRIRELGLTAGIWFMPFAGDHEDPFFADRQDWFVKAPDGTPYAARWGGTSLDMTHPDARAYLADVSRMLAKEWGYRYFKMDGMWTGTAAELLYVNNGYKPDDLGRQTFRDPDATPVEAYRSGIRLVREAAGDDVFLLGCCVSQNMRSFGGAFGLVDAMRIGPDNGAGWDSLTRGPWHGSNRYFLHGRVWYNDPDPVYVRPSMPLRHARLICSWVAVTGQFNVNSEWLPGLPPERLDILKRTLPSHNLKPRPVDLFERDIPTAWVLTDSAKPAPARHVVGLFNWDDTNPATATFPMARLGLDPDARYAGFDYWADRFVPPFRGELSAAIEPGSCRVLALVPVGNAPRVAGTSRHITQGVVDLLEETWDAESGILAGTSRLVAGDPYEIRVIVPTGENSFLAREGALTDPRTGESASLSVEGPAIRLRLLPTETREARWQIRFARGPVAIPAPVPVSNLTAEAGYKGVTLGWEAESATGFRVSREGPDGMTAEVLDAAWEDRSAARGGVYTYAVQSRNWSGEWSEPVRVTATMPEAVRRPPKPPAPRVHLSDLKPLQAATGWGQIGTDVSCEGKALHLGGERFARGMGVHAPSLLVYSVPEGARRFVAVAGIDEEKKDDPRCSVVFKVFGDVKEMGEEPALLGESPLLCDDTLRTWCFDIALPERVREIRLAVEDGGDGMAADHADWADAGFLP